MYNNDMMRELMVGNNVLSFLREIFEDKNLQTIEQHITKINQLRLLENKYRFLENTEYLKVFDSVDSFCDYEKLSYKVRLSIIKLISPNEFAYFDKYIIRELGGTVIVFKFKSEERLSGAYFAIPLGCYLEKVNNIEIAMRSNEPGVLVLRVSDKKLILGLIFLIIGALTIPIILSTMKIAILFKVALWIMGSALTLECYAIIYRIRNTGTVNE